MEKKTVYLAVYGKNQVPFKDLDSMFLYFSQSDNLFDAIMDDVQFYELEIKKIKPNFNTNTLENG